MADIHSTVPREQVDAMLEIMGRVLGTDIAPTGDISFTVNGTRYVISSHTDQQNAVVIDRSSGSPIDYSAFKRDPDNAGAVLGWGVMRLEPWAFGGLFLSKEAAEQEASARGGGFVARYGSYKLGTDEFVSSTNHMPD